MAHAAAEASGSEPLRVRGGLPGALLPFALFLAGVGWLGLQGAPDERGFWPILLAALAAGLLLARDRARYCDAVVAGMSQPIVSIMILAWLLAGVLSTLLGASGFVEALVYLAGHAGLSGGAYVAATFLACCLVSTSTGTSFGTILVCGPLLYPAGGRVGAEPAFLIGAILGGATFGDSISPISDTTIASAGTQGADIGGVVASRLKYVLPAGLLALALFAALGGAPAAAGEAGPNLDGSPAGLPMLAVPAFVLAMLLARRHLLEGLLFGSAAAAALAVALGLIRPGQLLYVDAARFGARGLVLDGLEKGVGVTIFTLLLVGLVGSVRETDLLRRLVAWAERSAASVRSTEALIVAAVSGAVLLTTHSVVAMLVVGDFTRAAGARAGLSAYRRANLLDVTVCTYPFLLPYFLPTILASSATASGQAYGMPRLGPLAAGLHNCYSWLLLIVVVLAVLTGYGRGEGTKEAAR